MSRQLLIVDDDVLSARLAAQVLAPLAFQTQIALTVQQARHMALTHPPALALLDGSLPDGPGFELCGWLRQRWSSVAILCISGYVAPQDQQAALDLGADGFLGKPYAPAELLAHTRAILIQHGWRPIRRRSASTATNLDIALQCLTLPDRRQIALTATETRIMDILLHHPGQLMADAELCQTLWGATSNPVAALIALDAHLRRLRSKIEGDPLCPRYLRYLPGQGTQWGSPEPTTARPGQH